MKIKIKNRKNLFLIWLFACLTALTNFALSQTICGDNVNTAYGLNSNGVIHPINLTTGAVGARLDSLTTGSAGSNANGLGYNSYNSKFYYFHRSGAATAPIAQFVAYDPAAHTLQLLPGTPPTNKIRSGCVANDGLGYYCIDGTTGTLYYYKFSTGTWIAITTVYKNGATDVSADFKSLVSGDMAFDANGTLWIMLSGSSKYIFYLIPSPVPKAAQASVPVQLLIPMTATPTPTFNFSGFGFNSNGDAFLTTGTGNNILYTMTTATSAPSFVANMNLNDASADLTTCIYTYVLPVKWLGFTAKSINQKGVQLKWDVIEDVNVKQYYIERSTDAAHWEKIAAVQRKGFSDPSHIQYDYTDYSFHSGENYYRIIQEDVSGKTHSSEVKQVVVTDQTLCISPNPAKDKLIIKQTGTIATQAEIFDSFGRLIMKASLHYPNETIDVSQFIKGNYFLKLSIGTTEISHASFIKL